MVELELFGINQGPDNIFITSSYVIRMLLDVRDGHLKLFSIRFSSEDPTIKFFDSLFIRPGRISRKLGGASTGTTKNINIKNNIIAHTVSGAIVQGGNVVMDKVDISNNDIFDIEQTTDPVWTGTKPTNLTYANNLHVVPMFVSATDFHLQAGSPVIDKGVNVGLAFKGAAPDMGYAEH